MKNLIKKYLNFLQRDVPFGIPASVPALDKAKQTTNEGVYIVGDLTGVPLLKLATGSSVEVINHIAEHKKEASSDVLDVLIIGAGPAGVEAGIKAKRMGLGYLVLEASQRPFNTIEDFPKGKSMFYEPEDLEEQSVIKMRGEKKEEFLENLNQHLREEEIKIEFGQRVVGLENQDSIKLVKTSDHTYKASNVVVAMGKTGNYRKLGVEGEDLSHVYYKLFDPADFRDKKVLVVGGGDSAAEASILLSQAGAEVTINYYGDELTKPKEGNIQKVNTLSEEGKIKKCFGTSVTKIEEEKVSFEDGRAESFDTVFIFIGSEPPFKFLRSIGVELENEKSPSFKWWMFFSISAFNIIYFGKWSSAIDMSLANIFSGDLGSVFVKLLAWASILTLLISAIVVIKDLVRQRKKYFASTWLVFRNTYFIGVVIFYLLVFVGAKYYSYNILGKDPYFWYSFLYTLSIATFGVARVFRNRSKYILYQTTLVFLIQAIPLFIIPNFVLPYMDSQGLINEWIRTHVFLGGEWWRFVGFILAWPLFIWNILTNEPSGFWLVTSLVQTFIIVPWLVYMWGKGAYCSWICSCGAMAETMGDEHRTKAWRGKESKDFENWGQFILFVILILSILHYTSFMFPSMSAFSTTNIFVYQFIVDTVLAGILGFGLYYFYSGRVWCRFFCPLAALMHIYNKFSRWTIRADKKRCISCGLCTRNCHMGIDVMAYAEKGKDVLDVECVNCSACVYVCPTKVLSFGKKSDTDLASNLD